MTFVQGLNSNYNAEIRSRIKKKKYKKWIKNFFQKLSDVCQRMVNLKLDNAKIKERHFTYT